MLQFGLLLDSAALNRVILWTLSPSGREDLQTCFISVNKRSHSTLFTNVGVKRKWILLERLESHKLPQEAEISWVTQTKWSRLVLSASERLWWKHWSLFMSDYSLPHFDSDQICSILIYASQERQEGRNLNLPQTSSWTGWTVDQLLAAPRRPHDFTSPSPHSCFLPVFL